MSPSSFQLLKTSRTPHFFNVGASDTQKASIWDLSNPSFSRLGFTARSIINGGPHMSTTCVDTCVCVCVWMCVCACVRLCACVWHLQWRTAHEYHLYTHTHMSVCVCVCVCVCVWERESGRVCVRVCMRVCVPSFMVDRTWAPTVKPIREYTYIYTEFLWACVHECVWKWCQCVCGAD